MKKECALNEGLSSEVVSLGGCDFENSDDQSILLSKLIHSRYVSNSGFRLSSLHRSIDALSRSNFDEIFCWKRSGGVEQFVERVPKRLSFIGILLVNYQDIDNSIDGYRASPHYEIAKRIANQAMTDFSRTSLYKFSSQNEQAITRLRGLFEQFHASINSEETRAAMGAYRRCANANYHTAVQFVERCAQKRSNLLVLRLDVYYRKGLSQSLSDKQFCDVTPSLVRRHRGKFHKELWSRYGDAMIGFLWCLEWGRVRKLHLHYLIFLDAAKHQQDVLHCQSLGKYWVDSATSGLGDYFNVNAKATKAQAYSNKAVGKVSVREPEVLKGLHFIAAYFTLARLYLRLETGQPCRTLGHSKSPQINARVGRPPKFVLPTLPSSFRGAVGAIAFI